MILLGYSPS
jgi:MULE transposase domain